MQQENDDEKMRDLLLLIGSRYTIEILRYITGHEIAQYKELENSASFALGRRLTQLLEANFIHFHIRRGKARKEFYSMTQWGVEFLKVFESIEELVVTFEREKNDRRASSNL